MDALRVNEKLELKKEVGIHLTKNYHASPHLHFPLLLQRLLRTRMLMIVPVMMMMRMRMLAILVMRK